MDIPLKSVSLKKLKYGDEEDIFDNISEEVVKWMPDFPWPYTKENAKEYVENSIKNFKNKNAYDFGIIYKKKVIGTISLFELNRGNNAGRIAYLLNKNYWGNKIISESVLKILDFGFHKLGLDLIYTGVIPENKVSEKILIKTGFVKTKINKNKFLIKKNYYHENIYEINKEIFNKILN